MMNLSPLKAQPLVGPFNYQHLLYLGLLAAFMAFVPLEVVAVAVVAIAGLILLLRYSWLIWALIALALPFTSAVSIGPATVTDILVISAIGFWLIHGVRRRELRFDMGLPTKLVLLFAAFQAGLLWLAVDLAEAIPEVVKWGEILLVLMLMPTMVSAENRHRVLTALLIAGALQAVLGVVQFVFQLGHPSFILMARFMRASGTFAQPNPYAGYLGTLLPVGVSLTLFALARLPQSNRRLSETFREFLFYSGVTALIGIGMIVSWSRGGWLGTLAGVGFVVAFRSRRALLLSLLAGLLLLFGVLLNSFDSTLIPISIQERFGNILVYSGVNIDQVLDQTVDNDNFAIIERMAHWKAAILMWQESPLFGVGPGGYATVYPDIIRDHTRLSMWEEPLGHAHNIYLNFLAEIGIIGLLLYLGMMIGILNWVWRQIRDNLAPNSRESALAIGFIGVLIYLTVHNVFDNLYVKGIYLHLGFWLALLTIGPPKLESNGSDLF